MTWEPSSTPVGPSGRAPYNEARAALISAGLGGILFSSLTISSLTNLVDWYPQLAWYAAFVSLFHLLEFYITARYNASRLAINSFLLNNGFAYTLAHIVAIMEAFTLGVKVPKWHSHPIVVALGLVLVVGGQAVRSLAMIHAKSNFSHVIQLQKQQEHQLVTSGVYSIVRHPSYFGFLYWAVGLQIFMGSPLSTLAFAVVLWRFFNNRIRYEELHLTKFFGVDYVNYRKVTSTGIPGIP